MLHFFFCQQVIFWIDFFWNFRLTAIVAFSHSALLEFTLLFSFV